MGAESLVEAGFVVVLAWASASDLRGRIIPDRCSLLGAVLFTAGLAVGGPGTAAHVAWGVGLLGLFGVAAVARPGALGGGDVKLAGVVGLATGPGAPLAVILGLAAALAWAWCREMLVPGPSDRPRTIALAPWLSLGAAGALGLVG